ncbi:MAG: hypothetical protein RIR70_1309 [Pseudomonadota bacterium]|jgi:outer membrane lipoprotein SlyB
MKTLSLTLGTALITLAGCQTGLGPSTAAPMGEQIAYQAEQSVRLGTVTRIEPVELDNEGQLGLGAVLGAAAGGILGHQIGSGSGQDVATVLGVIGGAVAGNVFQKKYLQKKSGEVVTVRLTNGVTVVVTQEADSALRVGDKVVIEGAGQAARVRLR